MMAVNLKISDVSLQLINLYGPNKDNPLFYNNISKILEVSDEMYALLCGDFNLALNPEKDILNYHNINNPNSRMLVLETIKNYSLVDVFRELHTEMQRYTWRRKKPFQQARLDYFLASYTFMDLPVIHNCKILPGYRSDHSLLVLDMLINNFEQGKGIWKFNTSLLKEQAYITMINNTITDEVFKYALPVYNLEFLENTSPQYLQFTINDNLFLESLLVQLQGEITYKICLSTKK